ncbi:MAG: hypothetical protein PHH40_02465 [Candidatus Moranbacteria bacterium]|nr:hypothetical protein [Candidatus Moranbacteria bacterium]MDD3965236.1 hypothetical protein [Candidatus Moranbacteria bacterium]
MNKKLIVILISVVLIVALGVYIKLYELENFSFLKNKQEQSISISDEDKLVKRFNEIFELESNNDFGKIYDSYLSPESKHKISREKYIEKRGAIYSQESVLQRLIEYAQQNPEDERSKIFLNDLKKGKTVEVNKVIIKNDIGHVDETSIFNLADKDYPKRIYRKFIKINNEWLIVFNETPIYCIRESGYEMSEEFKRSLSLIEQRYRNRGNIEESGRLESIKNCLKIEYSESSKEINGAEGVFVFSPMHSLDEYLIKVSPKYSIKDDLLTAVLLRHELTHVFQYANNEDVNSEDGCYRAEASAFISEGRFVYHVLNDEEEKSLQSRMTKTQEVAQLFQTLLVIAKNEGDLIDEKALNFVKSIPYYQKQCKK